MAAQTAALGAVNADRRSSSLDNNPTSEGMDFSETNPAPSEGRNGSDDDDAHLSPTMTSKADDDDG